MLFRSARRALFRDRRDAGRKLADALAGLVLERPVLLALPRGGVPVGYEIARRLAAPLDLALVRKIGAPGCPELGLGAVVAGAHPELVLNDEIIEAVGPSRAYLMEEQSRQLAELERRRILYRGDRPPPEIAGRDVLVVDDGIATGGSIRAVLRAVAQARPARRIVAVPVAPAETVAALEREAELVICLATPDPFRAVGAAYEDFAQTSDEEVVALLRELDRRSAA